MALILNTLVNGSLLDKTGNQTLTLTAGASKGFIKAGLGQGGLDFDGADTTLVTNLTSNAPFISGFTMSAWIKPDSLGETAGRILDKAEGTNGVNGFNLYIYTNNVIRFTNNTTFAVSANNSAPFSIWTHVIITVTSAGTANFYINGLLSGTANQAVGALSSITTANPLTIGNLSTATDRTFDGLIQNVKVWNTVLTQAEIDKEYTDFVNAKQVGNITRTVRNFFYPNPKSVSDNNLTLAYNMNPVAGTVVDISNNGRNGTVSGALSTKGVFGNCLRFDGVDDNIATTAASNVALGNSSTVSMWINPATIAAGTEYPFFSQRSPGSTYMSIVRSSALIRFYYADNAAGVDSTSVSSTTSMIVNKWYHVAIVRENTTDMKLYINGVLEDSATNGGQSPNSDVLYIGSLPSAGSTCFEGLIEEPRVWNRVLSATEIAKEYAKGARQVLFKEDWSTEGADSIAKLPDNWSLVSGSGMSISQLSADSGAAKKGMKYLNPSTAVIAAQLTTVPGAWEGVFNVGGTGANLNKLILMGSATTSYNGYGLRQTTDGKIQLAKYIAGTYDSTVIESSALTADTWYSWKVTRTTGGSWKLYINGTLINTASETSYGSMTHILSPGGNRALGFINAYRGII